MSHSIHLYRTEVEKLKDYGGTKKETAIRSAFFNLLDDYAHQRGLIMVAEVSIKTPSGKIVTPDGTLKDSLRQDWGYWESKDEADDLDEEILKKFAKGYPKDNILFEDCRVAVLIQNGEEVMRCFMSDKNALHLLLTEFFLFERPEVRNFRKAIELFKEDIPKVTDTIRKIIMDAETNNKGINPLVKVKLRADKEAGIIYLDEQTELHDIPSVAWDYKLGNRSALEWILDQYQEKTSKDPTIAEMFNTYRLADYKDQVIDLLKRVCTISVETIKILEEMKEIQITA